MKYRLTSLPSILFICTALIVSSFPGRPGALTTSNSTDDSITVQKPVEKGLPLNESSYCDSLTEKDSWKSGRPRGWFFNNLCLKRPEKSEEKSAEPVKPLEAQKREPLIDWKKLQNRKELYNYLSRLNGKELKEFLDNVLLEASTNPSEEVARVFFYTQRFIFNKSIQFANAFERVMLQEPHLNPLNTSLYSAAQSSTYGERVVKPLLHEQYTLLAKELSRNTGILFFVSATCPFCKAQAPIIEGLRIEYGLKYRTISRDSCEGYQFCVVKPEKFVEHGIDYVPAVIAIFIVNDRPVFQPIAYGITQGDVIIDRIYRLYNSYQGKDVVQGFDIEGKEE